MKPRTPKAATRAVNEAREIAIQSGDTPIANNEWDAHEAALDGRPKEYLAEIISGKREGPYEPTSHFTSRHRGRGSIER